MREGPRDECGVVAIATKGSNSASQAYYALFSLQHRGQEAAGIATENGGRIQTVKNTGLVSQVFNKDNLTTLRGTRSIGHVRYSTKGASSWRNAQPVWRDDIIELVLAHNGNLINAVELYGKISKMGGPLKGTSDSEIMAALISEKGGSLFDAVCKTMPTLQGAYSTVVMSHRETVAFRDPAGVRPLVVGELDDGYIVASETCALDIVGARFLREVSPGECLLLSPEGIESRQALPAQRAMCVFEHIYFARPDSVLYGKNTQQVRGKMGEILAEEHPADADIVIGVPDSGNPAAGGYSRVSGIPRDEGLIKNRYIARTFIEPGKESRQSGVKMKFNPLPAIVAGKKLVVVDDSIVRGNTTRRIVELLRGAGASEIHLRISAPAIKHPCYYGIDMSTKEEMVAHNRDSGEVAKIVGADSLEYISLDGIYRALGESSAVYCDACFSGNYKLGKPNKGDGKESLNTITGQ